MEREDLSQNRVVSSLTKLVGELALSQTPAQTLGAIRRSFDEAYETVDEAIFIRADASGEYEVVDFENEAPESSRSSRPQGGIIGAIVENPQPQLIQNVNWSSDPYFRDTLAEYTSIMALPLAGTNLPMNWAILLKRRPGRFTQQNLEDNLLRSTLIAALLDRQEKAIELSRAYQRIDADIAEVEILQRALLPDPLPHIAGFEMAVAYNPSGRAGGDLYDFFPANGTDASSAWCIFIGDASGHGLAAAVVMAMVQAILHAHPAELRGPNELLMYANRQLCDKKIGGFFTAFLAIYDPAWRRLQYACAGHPPPLLKTAVGGKIIPLDAAGGFPLGIESEQQLTAATIEVDPGDMLLLYTDGITEARNPAGELFGADRLEQELSSQTGAPDEFIETIRKEVRRFEESNKPIDDQTLIVIRVV